MRLTRGNPILAGMVLIAIVLASVLTAVAINQSFGLPGNLSLGLPPSRDATLRATFADANGLNRGASVVVAGAQVGQVTAVVPGGRQALVSMRIDHRFAPIHAGTVARIRYSTLLAQKFVELSPAAGTPALPDGATIPSDQTVTPVDFDQFLSALDPQTRRQAQVLVQQLGGGVAGRSATLNLLLDQLSGLTEESRGGLDTLDRHATDLDSITADLAIASRRLARSREQLGDLVDQTGRVSGTLAENDRTLDELLVHLGRTTTDLDQTLDGNERNLHDTVVTLDPFLVQLDTTLATTYPYLHAHNQDVKAAFDFLIPYIGSAIAQQDANGNFLREYIVLDTCFGQLSATRANPSTGQGCLLGVSTSGQAPPGNSHDPGGAPPAAAPKAPSAAAPKPGQGGTKCPAVLPTPPPLLPTLPPCPDLLACLPPPSPSPGATPTPTPSPSPSPAQCLGLDGLVHSLPLPLPLPLPSPLGGLLGLP